MKSIGEVPVGAIMIYATRVITGAADFCVDVVCPVCMIFYTQNIENVCKNVEYFNIYEA